MSEERNAWSQMDNEPSLWYGRFSAFLRMGTRRSVNAAFWKETKRGKEKTRTNAGPDWYNAAKEWQWQERARAYDDHVRAEEDRIIAEERDKVLRSGFALMHKRIQELDKLTRKLIRMTKDEEKIWLAETRTLVMGEDRSQTIEKVTFNAPLFQVIDKYLDSIAKEVGERVKKKDVTITEMPPNVYLGFDPDQDGTEE